MPGSPAPAGIEREQLRLVDVVEREHVRGGRLRAAALVESVDDQLLVDEEGEGLGGRILRYLDEHPDAADTAEGIRGWWLLEQVFKESVGDVEDALDLLVSRGIVARIDRPDMPPVYRRARRDGRA